MQKEVWTSKELEELAIKYGATGITGLRSSSSVVKVMPGYKEVYLKSNKDIEKLREIVGKVPYILADAEDWKTIPAENLVAAVPKDSGTKLIMKTNEFEEAKSFLNALELGLDGVYVDDGKRLGEICSLLGSIPGAIKLVDVEVRHVETGEVGDRVCVDFTSYLNPREGLLVGSMSNFLFLANSETEENPWVEPRPCRVNASYIHSYVFSGHQKTKYLSELRRGNRLPVVGYDGETRICQIGRLKIERRLGVQIDAEYNGLEGTVFSQYAETVKLVSPAGVIPVNKIKAGDLVKAYVREKSGGMHFGTFVKGMSSIEK